MPLLPRLRGAVSHRYTRTAALYLTGGAIGALSNHGILWLMPLALAFPALFLFTTRAADRWAVPLGYYGGATLAIFPGAAVFFGHAFNPVGTALIWVVIALLLSLPWAVFCNQDRIRLGWAVPACLLLELLPPLGLISVAHPANASGLILPHTEWAGLAIVIGISGLIAGSPRYALPILGLLVSVNSLFAHAAPAPQGWRAVNTTLGGQGIELPDPMRNWQTAQFIQRTALHSDAAVIVFPESLVRWNNATEAFWKPTLDRLRSQHRTLVLGATILQPGTSGDYRNVAVLRGADSQIFDQRLPIPFTMWNPLSSPTVPLNLYASGTITTHQQRAALLICYEQLLPLPLAASLSERPTLIVGIANDYWAKQSSFPRVQKANLEAWGLLFHLPVLTATNE